MSATNPKALQQKQGRRLQRLGVLLFLFGLITGFLLPLMANPRMGLSSHLEGVMNGTFVLLLGVIWPGLKLGRRPLAVAYGLAIYGTFVNWAVTLLSGFWGAGGAMMPFAAEGFEGASWQEMFISFGLISLSVAMVVLCVMVLVGLRHQAAGTPEEEAAAAAKAEAGVIQNL